MENQAIHKRVAVILVGARNPLNIGAVARAMSNFGFADLRVVNDYRISLEDARSAVNAADVLHSAREFASVAESVADCNLVYGTTAVGMRNLSQPVDTLVAAQPHIAENTGTAAILFGSEKHGLTNDAISHCHRILTVPMHATGVSMNLGQAAAVCLYELIRADAVPPQPVPTDMAPATAAQMQIVDQLLREALHTSGYMERYPANANDQELRELTRRLAMPGRDVPIWLGFLRQFLWKMRGPNE